MKLCCSSSKQALFTEEDHQPLIMLSTSPTRPSALKLDSGSVVSVCTHYTLYYCSSPSLDSKALQLSGQSLGQLYTTCENGDVNKIVLFCIGNDVTERHALFYSLYGSPCYDRGPVVHDWKCDDKQPVVIQIPSRVDDKYFFWPKT